MNKCKICGAELIDLLTSRGICPNNCKGKSPFQPPKEKECIELEKNTTFITYFITSVGFCCSNCGQYHNITLEKYQTFQCPCQKENKTWAYTSTANTYENWFNTEGTRATNQ